MSPSRATALIIFIILPLLFSILAARAEGGFPLTIIDDFGRSVTISAPPKRIVSTAPSNTEILFALGLGDNVVGVTRYCDYPPIVLEKVKNKQITVIGGYADPSFEGVVSLSPDLVLAATDLQSTFVSTIQDRGIVVISLNPKNTNDVVHDLALVGTACGRASAADKIINDLQRRLSYISDRTSKASGRPKVYYELWYDPLMSFGSNTVVDELIAKAGADNIFHDSQTMYPIVNSEMVIQKNPDVIIVPQGYMGGITKADFEKRAGWNTIKAVKEGRIYTVDENLLIRMGPRISSGLESLASVIHPELFTGKIYYNASIAVTSNSTVFALIYDDARKLLNFTVIGRNGTTASVRVEIPQRLIRGSPMALVDGIEKAISVSTSQDGFIVEFTTSLSTRNIVVGGSETIPEFREAFIVALILPLFAVFAILKFRINRTRASTIESICAMCLS